MVEGAAMVVAREVGAMMEEVARAAEGRAVVAVPAALLQARRVDSSAEAALVVCSEAERANRANRAKRDTVAVLAAGIQGLVGVEWTDLALQVRGAGIPATEEAGAKAAPPAAEGSGAAAAGALPTAAMSRASVAKLVVAAPAVAAARALAGQEAEPSIAPRDQQECDTSH